MGQVSGSAKLKVNVLELRQIAWRNFAAIVHQTGTTELLPKPPAGFLAEQV
jgi:hypothetical protein